MALTSLKKYCRGKCVSAGPMTQLYRGKKTDQTCSVAMKMPLGELCRDYRTLVRFHREFSVGREIRHQKIAKMLDLLWEKGKPILVSEWIADARPLSKIQRDGLSVYAWRLPQIMQDMADALAFFNSIGWIHQTLSPDTFVVRNETNETKLVEFPFVKSASWFGQYFHRPTLPAPGRYSSPEVICGEKTDSRSDAYSLACIFFELATGEPPYAGPTFNQLIHQHLNLPVPSADSVNPNVTPEFAKLLRRTMAKQPTERPASTTEFQNILKEIRIFKRQPQRPQ